ncbi:hypothetical protein QBC47DRAFT_216568 [Echria macrotheca]|uniref:Uncharacterized protein n=1 Tax=Echria macrotheca TaxID=438768 RepID=A0AAJ0BAN2_9PEZI|nr:hypothetical protein QBC47DRAFT_216568 [Echria macrotheca]
MFCRATSCVCCLGPDFTLSGANPDGEPTMPPSPHRFAAGLSGSGRPHHAGLAGKERATTRDEFSFCCSVFASSICHSVLGVLDKLILVSLCLSFNGVVWRLAGLGCWCCRIGVQGGEDRPAMGPAPSRIVVSTLEQRVAGMRVSRRLHRCVFDLVCLGIRRVADSGVVRTYVASYRRPCVFVFVDWVVRRVSRGPRSSGTSGCSRMYGMSSCCVT